MSALRSGSSRPYPVTHIRKLLHRVAWARVTPQQAVRVVRALRRGAYAEEAVTALSSIEQCVAPSDCDRAVAGQRELFREYVIALDRAMCLAGARRIVSQLRRWPTGGFTYNAALCALCRWELLEEALALRTELRERGVPLHPITYNAVLSTCGRHEQPRRALELLGEMVREGRAPDRATFNAMLSVCVEAGELLPALRIYRLMQESASASLRADAFTFNALLRACRVHGLVKSAFALKRDMDASGVAPDRSTFDALMSVCAQEGMLDKVLHLRRAADSAGVAEGAWTYVAVITACARSNQPHRAWQYYDEYRRRAGDADAVFAGDHRGGNGDERGTDWGEGGGGGRAGGGGGMTALDYVLGVGDGGSGGGHDDEDEEEGEKDKDANGDAARADMLGRGGRRRDARDRGAGVYTAAMLACSKAGDTGRAAEAFRDMQRAGHAVSAFCYNILVDAHCRTGDVMHAFELLREMKRRGLEPNTMSFSAIIDGLCRLALPSQRPRHYGPSAHGNACEPSETAAAATNDEAMHGGEHVVAGRDGAEIDHVGRAARIAAEHGEKLARQRRILLEKAFQVLAFMRQQHGIEPTAHVYASLVRACVANREVHRAFSLLDEMRAAGVAPNAVTYGVLIDSLGKLGDARSASDALDRMRAAGFCPNVVTFTSLIASLGKARDIAGMLRVYGVMVEAGVEPNAITLNTMRSFLRANPVHERQVAGTSAARALQHFHALRHRHDECDHAQRS